MAVNHRMATILFLSSIVFVVKCCEVDDVAVYKVKLKMLWSEDTFPKDYPKNRPKAQWSPVFGQSHNTSYALYRMGEVARPSVRSFTQFGKIDNLVQEGEDDPKVYDQFSAPAVGAGVGDTENVVLVDGGHSLVSLISHLIPSPDWFVGVDSVDLCVDFSWVDQITLDLEPLDAGAASGLTFTAPRWETTPPEPVTKYQPRVPDHPASGFYYPSLRELPTIAKVEFTKMKEYSTKELNELARQEIMTKLKLKEEHKGFHKEVIDDEHNDDDDDDDDEEEDDNEQKSVAAKNYEEHLKELEEEPFGTPRSNVADNNVIVITNAPSTTYAFSSTTEKEFDGGLKSMDDVVLAVAKGRRLGLGRHLPRHFRSRLHHAVNRIQPDDCMVSEWSDWTPCSATCGFGDKYRSRKVVRERRGDGRNCPALFDREHCGNANSCAHMDYFEW